MNNVASHHLDILDDEQYAPAAPSLTIDFKFNCPNCTQDLEGPVDLAGAHVDCPTCGHPFIVPAPPEPTSDTHVTLLLDPTPTNPQKRYWIIDVRVLVINAPPQYFQLITEVPITWTLPKDGKLPYEASEAIRKTISAKFPRCPVTPTKIQLADALAIKRISGASPHSDQNCRVWMLGKTASAL